MDCSFLTMFFFSAERTFTVILAFGFREADDRGDVDVFDEVKSFWRDDPFLGIFDFFDQVKSFLWG